VDAVRTLILLRHAKSDYPSGVPDHDRPLADRGIREAAIAGDWLRANAPVIDAVLCSTATRTRQTLTRTGIEAPVSFAERIYESTPGRVLAEINNVADDIGTLLVIGHEPVMSALALGLADGSSDAEAIAGIETKYPTSALAVLRTAAPWSGLELGGAQLVAFHIAR
jgi:phosphohistidine phosphatase